MINDETNSNDELSAKKKFQGQSIPEWHKELLDERRRAIDEGRERLLDWDQIKGSLGKRRA